LQVLLAAQASWQEDLNSMHVQAPSADFLLALELFGVTPEHLFQEDSIA
jgi:hypothetical protein